MMVHGAVATAFVAPLCALQTSHISKYCFLSAQPPRRDNDGENDSVLIAIVDQIGNFVSQPSLIPGAGSNQLALGYPLAFVASVLVIPLPTVALSVLLFVGFSYLGRKVMIEENDEGEKEDSTLVNLASLMAAFASAGLLAPPTATTNNFEDVIVVGALGLVAIAVTFAVAEEKQELSELEPQWLEQDRLRDWDTQLQRNTEELKDDTRSDES